MKIIAIISSATVCSIEAWQTHGAAGAWIFVGSLVVIKFL